MNTTLPNLSAWHRVPTGAVIPKNTPYASAYSGGVVIVNDGYREDIAAPADVIRYTEHPITPPLPTEEGTTIAVSSDERPPHVLLTRKGGRWVNHYGVERTADQIRAWALVKIGETVVMP